MNNKGYISSGILVVILLFCVLYLAIIHGGILNTAKDVRDSGLLTEELVKDMNGKERLYSTLKKNVSFVGELSYQDIERDYVIETIDEDYELEEVFASSYSPSSFTINNKTPINVQMTVAPIDNEESFSYSAELNLNGRDMLGGSASNLSSNFNYTIDSDEIYNPDTGEVNYGNFNIDFINLNNCTVAVYITYDKLVERQVNIKGGTLDRDVLISIEDNQSVIEFVEGR